MSEIRNGAVFPLTILVQEGPFNLQGARSITFKIKDEDLEPARIQDVIDDDTSTSSSSSDGSNVDEPAYDFSTAPKSCSSSRGARGLSHVPALQVENSAPDGSPESEDLCMR